MKRFTYYILFLVSYLPLFLILFVQNLNIKSWKPDSHDYRQVCVDNIISIGLLALSLLSLVFAYFFEKSVKGYGFNTPERVLKVKNTGVEYLTYLGTYIIPFIGLKFDTINNTIATILLILLIALIYPRTNLIYANPTIALFGYNIYKVVLQSDADEEIVVITKEKIKKSKSYRLKNLADDIFFAIKT